MSHILNLEKVLSDLDSGDANYVRNALVEAGDLINTLPSEGVTLLRTKLHELLVNEIFEPELRATAFWVLSKHPSEHDLEVSVEFLKLNGFTLHPFAVRQIAVLADEFLIRSDRNLVSDSIHNLLFIQKTLEKFPGILSDFDELSDWSNESCP